MNLKRKREEMFACLLIFRTVCTVQECKLHSISQKPATERYAPYCSALLAVTIIQLSAFRSSALYSLWDKTVCYFSSQPNLWKFYMCSFVTMSYHLEISTCYIQTFFCMKATISESVFCHVFKCLTTGTRYSLAILKLLTNDSCFCGRWVQIDCRLSRAPWKRTISLSWLHLLLGFTCFILHRWIVFAITHALLEYHNKIRAQW